MTVQTGQAFPPFIGPSHEGEAVDLREYQGESNLVVFFFGKAMTGRCVKETTEFSARSAEFDALNTKIVGMSVDDSSAQKEHAIHCAASFPIVSDDGGKLTRQLGILNEERGNSKRTTYILDKTGNVREVFENVEVDGHIDQVLDALKKIESA